MVTLLQRKIKITIALAILLITSLMVVVTPVAAVFVKSIIISENLFIDTDSMSTSQINDFLDDEGGTLLNTNWVDNVNIYQTDSRFQVPNNKCLVHKATGLNAAQIIHQAANDWQATYVEWSYQGIPRSKNPDVSAGGYNGPIDSCSTVKKYPDINLKTISPKVILATLNKEQSIVSANGGYSTSHGAYYDPDCCSSNEYKLAWAMGYGVPDAGGKRHQYKGFYNQVMYGAWQLRFNYEHSDGSTNWDGTGSWGYGGPELGETISIDGQSVKIETRSAASLYYYTPHIHGNQSFVNIYEGWFGSTIVNPNIRVTTSLRSTPSATTMGNDITTSFVIKNYENYPVELGAIKAAVRAPNGTRMDYPQDSNITIPAKSTYSYSKTKTFHDDGTYKIWIASFRDGYGWSFYYPSGTNSSIDKDDTVSIRAANVRVTSSILATPSPVQAGNNVTASFVVKNYETHSIKLGSLKAAARHSNGTRVDFPEDTDITIPAKSTYTYSESQVLNTAGTYNLWVASFRQDYGWSFYYPSGTNSSIVKSINLLVTP